MEILLTAAAYFSEANEVASAPDSELSALPPPEHGLVPEDAPPPPTPTPPATAGFDWHDLVDHDLWSQVPDDVPELLQLLPESDLYTQDEVEVRLHPTLTRVWSRKGRRNQRLVRAPGQNRKFVGFAAIDWREGWVSIGYGLRRTADVFCQQLDHLVERSQSRGRKAMVLLDNLGIHTPRGSKLLRQTLEKHGDKLRLVYTPTYDPEANPTERLFPPFRLAVTHNHHHDEVTGLYADTLAYFDRLDCDPNVALSHIGSPFANIEPTNRSRMTLSLSGRS